MRGFSWWLAGPRGVESRRRFAYSGIANHDGGEISLRPAREGPAVSGLGPSPTLRFSDAPPPANANADRPNVLRTRWTLATPGCEAWCSVDRQVMSAVQPGDVVHVATDHLGTPGISVLRAQTLIFAAGAVCAVPLGDVTVRRSPSRWHDEFASVVFLGGRQTADVVFRHDVPLEIMLGAERLNVPFTPRQPVGGLPRRADVLAETPFDFDEPPVRIDPVNDIHYFVWQYPRVRGAVAHMQVTDDWFERQATRSECVALARRRACPRVPAQTSAMLLAADGVTWAGSSVG